MWAFKLHHSSKRATLLGGLCTSATTSAHQLSSANTHRRAQLFGRTRWSGIFVGRGYEPIVPAAAASASTQCGVKLRSDGSSFEAMGGCL